MSTRSSSGWPRILGLIKQSAGESRNMEPWATTASPGEHKFTNPELSDKSKPIFASNAGVLLGRCLRWWDSIRPAFYSPFFGLKFNKFVQFYYLGFSWNQPFKPSRCNKASFYIPENRLNFPTTKGFWMKISMKLVHEYIVIFFIFSPSSNHLHPLQVANYDSNSRLVVDEDDYVKSGLKGLNNLSAWLIGNCILLSSLMIDKTRSDLRFSATFATKASFVIKK